MLNSFLCKEKGANGMINRKEDNCFCVDSKREWFFLWKGLGVAAGGSLHIYCRMVTIIKITTFDSSGYKYTYAQFETIIFLFLVLLALTISSFSAFPETVDSAGDNMAPYVSGTIPLRQRWVSRGKIVVFKNRIYLVTLVY
jgi:hypothetical protein